jgi:NDP-sugar pyrophosphorylase family protein
MNELQLTIEEMQLGYMEAKVQQMNPNVPDRDPRENDFDNEYELFDRLIEIGPINNVPFIMHRLSARQRADFWDRVSVVNAYEHDGMSEREYMVILKKDLYTQYLRNQ